MPFGSRRRPLSVVIDARLVPGESGGVEGVVIGIASGLSRLSDGDEQYRFVTWEDADEWLRPYVGGATSIVAERIGTAPPTLQHRIGDAAPVVRALWRRRPGQRPIGGPPSSDPFVQALRPDVIHFPFQRGFRTRTPSIFHPHDLQHVHLPEFFSAEERERRETWYAALCRQAAMVAVASSWTKADVTRHFRLPPDRVRVVPLAPPTDAYPAPSAARLDEIRSRLDLPSEFILYPAQTWPHKNHLGLLAALAQLRDRDGLTVPLVAPGRQTEHFPALEAFAAEHGLSGQVRWLGFVSAEDLRALYALARAVVIPSRFEAASAPLWEAFRAGAPAATSNVTSLPEQAGNAALLFDPDDTDGMAAAIHSLWTDAELRERLARAGEVQVAGFNWDRTARTFRAHYRRLARLALSTEDRDLLDEPPAL